ncbi:MAG: hypothetical protein AAFY98_02475 [Verrucomicrobiota bacterium]
MSDQPLDPNSSSTAPSDTSQEEIKPKSYQSIYWPLALLALSFLLFLAVQLWSLESQRRTLLNQYQQRNSVILQTQELQNRLNAILNELVILSPKSAQARAIAEKYQNSSNLPSTTPTAP